MEFVDSATITVRAGDGGDGVISFRREKYIAQGGPDGGDGGRGGSIFLTAATELNSLVNYKYRSVFRAGKGQRGSGRRKHGQNGDDLRLAMPIGTLVRNHGTNELIGEILANKELLVARGGKGGFGNHRFKSSTNRSPRHSTAGLAGEERALKLELRLFADVVFIGLPNSGKSALLAALTGSQAKVASYPFSTLSPQPGVAQQDIDTPKLVLLDMPAVVAESSQGKGLGADFLKHALRASLLFYVINGAHDDPVNSLRVIREEFAGFGSADPTESTELAELAKLKDKPYWIIITAQDLLNERQKEAVKRFMAESKAPVFLLSSLSGRGVGELLSNLNDFFIAHTK